jgi:hypothetical protein
MQAISAFGRHTGVQARDNKFQINNTALTLANIKASIAMSRRCYSRRKTSPYLILLSSSYPAGSRDS